MASDPSLNRRVRWLNAAAKSSCTTGRGGRVLVSLRWSFTLKASSTAVARLCVALNRGSISRASSHDFRAAAGSLMSTCVFAAVRKTLRRPSRLVSPSATASEMDSPARDSTRPTASARRRCVSVHGMLVKRSRLYVLGTKSSSCMKSVSSQATQAARRARSRRPHLEEGLRPDALNDEVAGLEHAQAVCAENLEHRLLVPLWPAVSHKACLFQGPGFRHQEGVDVDAGEECLRQRVSQMPRHLRSLSFCRRFVFAGGAFGEDLPRGRSAGR